MEARQYLLYTYSASGTPRGTRLLSGYAGERGRFVVDKER